MIKLLKEIFSSKNIKRALIYNSLAQEHYTATDVKILIDIIKDLDSKDVNITEEKQMKKAA